MALKNVILLYLVLTTIMAYACAGRKDLNVNSNDKLPEWCISSEYLSKYTPCAEPMIDFVLNRGHPIISEECCRFFVRLTDECMPAVQRFAYSQGFQPKDIEKLRRHCIQSFEAPHPAPPPVSGN